MKYHLESQLKAIQEKLVQGLQAWQASLLFQQSHQKEIESIIANTDLALQIDDVKRQNALSITGIDNQCQPIIMNLATELKTIKKVHAIYYFSNQTQGLSLSALYLLSLLLSLILAVVFTYIISLFTTVKLLGKSY